jgi:hypothetical protein
MREVFSFKFLQQREIQEWQEQRSEGRGDLKGRWPGKRPENFGNTTVSREGHEVFAFELLQQKGIQE